MIADVRSYVEHDRVRLGSEVIRPDNCQSEGAVSVEKLQEGRSLPSLEGLRLIASVSIVASHYLQYLHLPTHGLHLAVDLFFVISGIVIAMIYQGRINDMRSYFGFVRKRLARLYPLHLATIVFYVIIG